ncbi:hypothetical protein BK127_31335 [Paenibacillus sp. FSL H7-0331]|nr:hypothetical protein BK127_31335 [Paenibacillus sp. FSL H7-0331]
MIYEKVHTMHDWWDGLKAGVAEYQGIPYIFTKNFSEELDDYDDYYLLNPITDIIPFVLVHSLSTIPLLWAFVIQD